MERARTACIVTIGTELTTGLRQDTNGGEVARALGEAGYSVRALTSLPDDADLIETTLRALLASCSLVIVTGGLGPTHDDITREAAARALSRGLHRDSAIAKGLEAMAGVHASPEARASMIRQADVIDGARVLPAVAGSAPGQVIRAGDSTLVLLPGPPHEMRPLLAIVLKDAPRAVPPVRLRCTGITESDAQALVQPAIARYPGVEFTILAAPGEVEIVLLADTVDAADLAQAGEAARAALGDVCFSADGSTLAETVIQLARTAGVMLTCAESCTGGLVAAALTAVPGASYVFVGGVVSYANATKSALLGVDRDLLEGYGAVSEPTARSMAEGALSATGAACAVATTGVAGPGGGTRGKPVGLVWFAVARAGSATTATRRRFGGDREIVRRRATATALDLLRRELEEA